MDLNEFISSLKKFHIVYGPAASGKTTLCIRLAVDTLTKKKKVIYLDTENGFSLDRFFQIAGPNSKPLLDDFLLFRVHGFKEQLERVKSLLEITKKTDVMLIIVDTMNSHYRRLVKHKRELSEAMLKNQLKILKYISKKIPIVITNQVYTNIDTGKIEFVGNGIMRGFSADFIKLEKDPLRTIYYQKNKIHFNITEKGLEGVQ